MLLSAFTLALLTAALLTNNGCGATPQPSSSATANATVTTVPQSFTRLLSLNSSGFSEPTELVVRDETALAKAWKTLHRGLPGNPPPTVDFTRSMVVIVGLGARPTGGHTVRFDGMTRNGENAVVRYTATAPGPECMTTQSLTSPVDVVSVPRAGGAVRFERIEAVGRC